MRVKLFYVGVGCCSLSCSSAIFYQQVFALWKPDSFSFHREAAILNGWTEPPPHKDTEAPNNELLPRLGALFPSSSATPVARSQNLLEDNGGTVLAVAGPDYCILAADTRLSSEYRIRTRNVTRLLEISPQTFVGMAGSWADLQALRRELAYEVAQFNSRHGYTMTTKALGRFLSNRLYQHRLQPMYTFNIVAGLDEQGRGAIYTYDVIGSFNRVNAACCGRGQELMQPILDQFISEYVGDPDDEKQYGPMDKLTFEQALQVVKQAFSSGAEREISIGDGVDILLIRKGWQRAKLEHLPLPRH